MLRMRRISRRTVIIGVLAAVCLCVFGYLVVNSVEWKKRAIHARCARRMREFFKGPLPYGGVSESRWLAVSREIASLGPEITPALVRLARRSAERKELKDVPLKYFFEPILLLPKEDLRQAGLMLMKMPVDYLPSSYTRINGLRALALVHKEEDLQVILESLNSQEGDIRECATYCLGFWPADLVSEEIVARFDASSAEALLVDMYACVAAFNTGAEEFKAHFERLAGKESRFDIRAIALEALASLGSTDASEELYKMAMKGDPIHRLWAFQALTRAGAYGHWKELGKALTDPDNVVVLAALDYLLEAPDKEARKLAKEHIGGDAGLRRQVKDWATMFFVKRPREDGKGYILYSTRP